MSADCILNNWRVDVYTFAPVSYGLLYNWYAATDARNIANTGWHVTTKTEFETLSSYLGGDIGNAQKLKEVGTTYWVAPNAGATNEVGYNARAAGYRHYGTGSFSAKSTSSYIWSQTEYGYLGNNVYYTQYLYYKSDIIAAFNVSSSEYTWGFSVRLVKDSTTLTHGQTGIYIGNDGKVYRTICIGTQEWLADNLCETRYRNGDHIPEVTDNAAWVALTTGAMCTYNNDWNNV